MFGCYAVFLGSRAMYELRTVSTSQWLKIPSANDCQRFTSFLEQCLYGSFICVLIG
jgi:hypothetical protein